MARDLPFIAIVGPPGAGKTTLWWAFKEHLSGQIQCISEVATLLITALGATPDTKGASYILTQDFGITIYEVQVLLEKAGEGIAKKAGFRGVLCDKGRLDTAVHFGGDIEAYGRILGVRAAEDLARYDLVLCMELPAEDVYNHFQNNNPCRFHDYDDAKRIEGIVRNVWGRHPNFVVIPDASSWEERVRLAFKTVLPFLA